MDGTREDLGPYRLVRELGRGGQSVVWLAEDGRVPRKVALKILDAYGGATEADLARLKREAAALAQLSHAGLRPILDVGIVDGRAYAAFPYLEGETLAAKLDRRRTSDAPFGGEATSVESAGTRTRTEDRSSVDATPVDRRGVDELLELFEKVARAVHVAHEAGVVHRDLKPANIFVTHDGEPVVLDFGLARDASDDTPVTRTGDVPGTPAYVAPERLARGGRDVDRRVDVWSLGVALFECVAGRRPFEGRGREAVYRSVLRDATPDPRRLNRVVSSDLRVVLEVALEKDPARRYATAAAFADDLAAVREGRATAARPPGLFGRALKFAARRPAAAALYAALTSAPIVATALWTLQKADEPHVRAEEARRIEAARDERVAAAFEILQDERRLEAFAAFEKLEREETPLSEIDAGLSLILLGDAFAAPERAEARGARVVALARRIAARGDAPFAAAVFEADALRAQGKVDEARALEDSAPPPKSWLDYFVRARRGLPKRTSVYGTRFRPAVEDMERAILLAPRPRAELFVTYAYAAGRANDVDAARRAAEAILRFWPDSPGALAGAALGLGLAGADEEAAPIYAIAYERMPGHPTVATNYAATLAEIGRVDEALALLKDARARHPNRIEYAEGLAYHLVMAKRPDEAVAAYDAALALDARHAPSLRGKARALCELRRPAEALPLAEAAVAAEPTDHDGYYTLGYVLRMLGRVEDSIAPLEEATRRAPENAATAESLARSYVGAGRAEDAIRAASAALAIDPRRVTALSIRGAMRSKLNDVSGAIEDLKAAVAVDPKSVTAAFQLAQNLSKAGRPAEAIPYFEAVPRTHAAFPIARLGRATCLATLGRFAEALADATAAEEATVRANRTENLYVMRRLRAVLSEHLGPPDRALAAYQALKSDPTSTAEDVCSYAADLMADGHVRLGDAALKVALRFDPSYAPATMNRAIVAWYEGRFAEAHVHASRAEALADAAPDRKYEVDVRRKATFATTAAAAEKVVAAADPTALPAEDARLSIALRALVAANRAEDGLRLWRAADAKRRAVDEEGAVFVAALCAAKVAAANDDAGVRAELAREAATILEEGRAECMRQARAHNLGARLLRRNLRSIERDAFFAPLREVLSADATDDEDDAAMRRAVWAAIDADARTLEEFLASSEAKASSRPAR